ncbi:MAG: bifunctional (p)ppGpp synthetase/guanosine-3',5'-bis(diphosphate) 3'-pyrophosphohydrolase [Ruminococcaceae bacterium]|nr:bifunctional (p)ppGpp synthetase/guanosine-3',5'-bis(diphosphate) 3'-pyrophosphohydrolase [Oscillospiraceae bacterium]
MEAIIKKITDNIKRYNERSDIDGIMRAYEYAKKAHEGQFRKSGDEYISHPLSVALIMTELEMDAPSVIAAILHDVVEDTSITLQDITEEFGEDVALLVDGVTKIGKIQYTSQEEQQIENLRKMFLAMAKDIRVILIKLADRLHNIRTLKSMTVEKQLRIARETMEVYAPLAHRLGMSKIKGELEDLSLKYLDPIGYQEISDSINQKKLEREKFINSIIEVLTQKLAALEIKCQINGRAKHFYSIYRKMYTQNKTLDEIYDLFAVRVIVDSVSDCYAVLGMVHELYKPMPMRFKDYIAMPKPNMYQSLHTTVIGPFGRPLEIQIRTWEMHTVAEKGIAAHWKYKEGVTSNSESDTKLEWVRQLLEMQKETIDEDDFMRTLKIDLFADEVFVFTPKGDVINLPAGATPIDFAFSIHSAIGYKMMGAKVNSKIVPIDHILKNGDIVEVLTSSSVHGPSRDWLKLVKTSQARNKINQWFKKERREENIVRGRELIEKELRRHSLSHSQLFRDEWIAPILKRYTLATLDDLYASVGYGGLTAQKVVIRLRDEYLKIAKLERDEAMSSLPPEIDYSETKSTKTSSNGIIVHGIDNCLVRLSKCCTPVPGDDIIGFITRGRGVSVHRRDCPNIAPTSLTEEDLDRFIGVSWSTDKLSGEYLSEIQVEADDRTGLLAEITAAITETKIPMRSLNARTTKSNVAIITFTVEISDTTQLETIIRKIRGLPGVYEVMRCTQ